MIQRKTLLVLLALCLLLPFGALADDAGVLSETELGAWVDQALRDSAKEQPLNAPVGEESLTEDGYAFLYSFATLYYDKPTLDQSSRLNAVAITDEGYAAPRGVRIGSDASALIDRFGWQNPMLLGDGLFAAFYRLDELPRAAYWSLAQREGEGLRSVQCGVHVQTAEDRYTDAGLMFTLENGKVSAIRVYGLGATVSLADARDNLQTVADVEASISGDASERISPVSGYAVKSDAKPFSQSDLRFGGFDALTLTENGATRLFGEKQGEERAQDDTGDWLVTTRRDGLTLSYVENADGSQSRLETLSMTKDVAEGPRGLRVGKSTLSEALAAFESDGEARTLDGAAILYGDGSTPPSGWMERTEGVVTLRYIASVSSLAAPVTLSLTFQNDVLTELMIYTW